jgi:hypothetical protein
MKFFMALQGTGFIFQAQVIVCNLQVFFIFTLYNTLKDNDQLKVQ